MNYLENVSDWVNRTFFAALGLGVVWLGRYVKRSKDLRRADDENAKASMVKEWVSVLEVANAPLREKINSLESEVKSLSDKTVELTIKVGILTNENERKDAIIQKKDERIRELETTVQVQSEEINRLKIRL